MNNADLFCNSTCVPAVMPPDPVIDCYDTGCWGATGSTNKKDYENLVLCDVVNATITGSVAYSYVGSLASYTPTLTFVGDTLVAYAVDFGNGYIDVGNNPSYDYSEDASGHYEIKVYALMASGNKILISTSEFDFDTVTNTFSNFASTGVVSRTYPIGVGSVRQNFEDGVLISTTDLSGNPYTVQGTLSVNCPERIQEFMQSNEFPSGETYPKVIGSGFGCIKSAGGNLFSIYSKIAPNGTEHPDFVGSILYADVIGGTHNGWFIYHIIAPSNPGSDSNGHLWNSGDYTVSPDFDASDVLAVSGTIPAGGITTQKVQWVKYQNIDGTIYDKYFELNSSNELLVEVPFDILTQTFTVGESCEAKVEMFETEVCGKVDGGTTVLELIRVYTRDELGEVTILRYEDTKGNVIAGVVEEVCCDCDAVCEESPLMHVADYYNVNSDGFLNGLGAPNPSNYSYKVVSFVVNGVTIASNVSSPVWTAPLNVNVAVQVAPYDTIPAYTAVSPFPVDYNWLNFLNGLGASNVTFRESPFDDSIDIVQPPPTTLPIPGYPLGNRPYGDGFQIVYPASATFSLKVEALYDGVVGHKMQFTETGNFIDGLPVAGAPTAGLTF